MHPLLLLVLALSLISVSAGQAQAQGGAIDTPKRTEIEQEEREEEREEEVGEQGDDEEEEKEQKSRHGEYEWKFAIGGGGEFGLFFTDLERFNAQLLGPTANDTATFDTDVTLNLDLAFEVYPVDLFRIALFGGIQSPFTDNPTLTALYGGLEPALAVREGSWEIAFGTGVGFGTVNAEIEGGQGFDTSLILLRPFLEARTYATDFFAVFARVGFNYWIIYEEELTGLEATNRAPNNIGLGDNSLNDGGLYLSIGTRFGHYPEPVAVVEDADGDGLRDDVDDCPEEPEDKDNFKDTDGCPDPDNDEDGVLDGVDTCPLEPEDIDTFEDTDGCPDPDNDKDGVLDGVDKCPLEPGPKEKQGCPERDPDKDGIFGDADACPDQPEDKDGFEDADGCPDPDNDKDGILDVDDKCPLEAETYNGNKDEDGCPDGKQTVVITKTTIQILEKVYFDTGKATIQPRSFLLLDTVATVLKQNPQITKLRVEGHTDDVGNDQNNLALSKDRAASVKTYLESKGIDPARLESEGYGEEKPSCTDMPELLTNKGKNRTEIEACRATNRRVGFSILAVNGKPIEASDAVQLEEKKVIEEPVPSTDPVPPTDPVPAESP